MIQPQNSEKTSLFEWLVLIFSLIGTVLVLGWVLRYSSYGFDFTDESFYLVWISNPFIYGDSTTQFGFIYHPLYKLLNGNIASLRRANIIITFCLAWGLVHIFLKIIYAEGQIGKWSLLALSSGFATVSMLFLVFWLPTPSYDSLALQALLIAAAGLLWAESRPTAASVLGWVLIGVGVWLAFMAKPTTAAALGLSAGLYLLVARKINAGLLLISAGTTLMLVLLSSFVLDGSISGFIQRLKTGLEFSVFLQGGHTISELMRFDDFFLSERNQMYLNRLTIAVFLSSLLLQSEHLAKVAGGIGFAALGLIFIVFVTFGMTDETWASGRFRGLLISAIPFAAVLLSIFLCREKFFKKITTAQWALALVFFALPHVYAFGTNGNYWQAGSAAGLFWVLSGLVLLAPAIHESKPWPLLFPLVIASQVIVVALIQIGLETPYRQPQPLRLNNSLTEIGRPGSELILSAGYSHYLEEAKSAARRAGLKAGTPVIDLSGQSPGVLYALGATNVGQAWLIGGYPGSAALTRKALKRVPCSDIALAWMLVEVGGPRSITSDVLAAIGADASKHYELAASWGVADGAGGYKKRQSQQLLRPVRSVAEASQACAGAGKISP